MVQENQELNKLLLLTFKGQLLIYDIIDSAQSHISDEIKLVHTIDIVTVLTNQEAQRNVLNKQAKNQIHSQFMSASHSLNKLSKNKNGKSDAANERNDEAFS